MHTPARAGLSHYVAGWDDPEVKRELGAHLSPMRHAVYPRNALLRMLVRRHVHRFESPVEDMPQIEALG